MTKDFIEDSYDEYDEYEDDYCEGGDYECGGYECTE